MSDKLRADEIPTSARTDETDRAVTRSATSAWCVTHNHYLRACQVAGRSDCRTREEATVPSKWRKKPVVVTAYQLTDDNGGAVADWCGGLLRGGPSGGSKGGHVLIDTLEGRMVAEPGDYVIRGVKGEHYPCKPDIFEATYEPA